MKKKQSATPVQGEYVLGFDGGGTKSICVIAQADGTVVGVGDSGATNFQGVGVGAAGQEVEKAIVQALKQAGISADQVATGAYGVSGADREADFDTVSEYVLPHNPAGHWLLANDTTIALRAGTSDGVGVALICGTGSNCIGFNAEGKQAKVGGLGRFTGDSGSGEDLVERAIIAAMRAYDGRGPQTMLYDRLCRALGLTDLVDIIAFFYLDDYRPVEIGAFAPLVFECAAAGDRVAQGILKSVGKELTLNTLTACRRLFKKDDVIPVVLGGSILQKSKPAVYEEMIRAGLARRYPNAKVVKLKDDPVLGAVFFALDMLHGKAGVRRMATVRRSYKALKKA